MSTKIYSCKYVEHLCMNKNNERDFKSQIGYFLIPSPTRSPTFSDQGCKQIKTMADNFMTRRHQLEFKLIIGNWVENIENYRCKNALWTFFCVHSEYVGEPIFLKSTRQRQNVIRLNIQGKQWGQVVAVILHNRYRHCS